MVECGNRPVGPSHFEATFAQTRKRLRRCNFVKQMKIDIQHCRRFRLLGNDVSVPDLFKKSP
jgi:hypothetical protein